MWIAPHAVQLQPQPAAALAPDQLSSSSTQRMCRARDEARSVCRARDEARGMYFVTYSSVRQQVADKGARTGASMQERRGRDQVQRQQCRVRQALEAARTADAQAAVTRMANTDRARLRLLELDSRSKIPPWEGLGRERGIWEAMWAQRQLGVSVRETRYRKAELPVYWETGWRKWTDGR